MKNLLHSGNLGLITVRQVAENSGFNHVFVSSTLIEGRMTLSNKGICFVYPLYVYHDNGSRTPNFQPAILKQFTNNLTSVRVYEPEDILDYIYAILHSPTYREKYKEFLKSDFPRIPAPKNDLEFEKLVILGKQLRELHLMQSPSQNRLITGYPETGSDIVEKVQGDFPITVGEVGNEASKRKLGRVYINEIQFFRNVPEVAWNFYIGGYQPAQKWLKDRKDRKLSSSDIEHYQKIIKALIETDQLMKRIDKIWQP